LKIRCSDPDPEDSLFVVQLHGTAVRQSITVNLDSISFGNVCLDTSKTLNVLTITNPNRVRLPIHALRFSDSVFSSVIDTFTLEPNKSGNISITFTPPTENKYDAHLDVIYGAFEREIIQVKLTGKGAADSIFGQRPIQFDSTAVGDTLDKFYEISADTFCDVQINSVAFDSDEFGCSDCSFPHNIAKGGSWKMPLRFTPADRGARTAIMKIWSTAQNENPFQVILNGPGTPAPCKPQIAGDSIMKFDSVFVCKEQIKEYEIRNKGNCALQIGSLEVIGRDSACFATVDRDGCYELPPDFSCKLKIRFAPQAAGECTAQLVISNNDMLFTVDLHGFGIADTLAPAKPESLQIDSLQCPSGWSNGSVITLTWNNPQDTCGIDSVFYKIGKPPTYLRDYHGRDKATPPQLDIEALKPGQDSVYVWLSDKRGNVNFKNHASAAVKFDNRGPALSHQPPSVALVDRDLTIMAIATDLISGLDSSRFELHFTRGGKSLDSASLRMIRFQNNTAVIPAEMLTPYGIEYLIVAQDQACNRSRLPKELPFYSIPIRLSPGRIDAIHTKGGEPEDYRLRSFPLQLDHPKIKNVFPDHLLNLSDPTVVRIWDIAPARAREQAHLREFKRWDDFTDLAPGRGIFMITEKDFHFFNGAGQTLPTNMPFKIPVQPGWNLISSPFYFPIPLQNLMPARVQKCVLYFDGHWRAAEDDAAFHFQPWQGYAVLIGDTGPDTLSLHPSENRIAPRQNLAPPATPQWQIQIIARQGSARDDDNFFGLAVDARADWDQHERLEPPHREGEVALYFSQRDWKHRAGAYATDFRLTGSQGYEWRFELRPGNSRAPVTLYFENVAAAPAAWQVYLHDVTLNHPAAIRQTPEYEFRAAQTSREPHRFRVLVGDSSFIRKELPGAFAVPATVELFPNFPNPFNPATTIRFGLPRSGPVTLTIYNINGKTVRNLMSAAEKNAGYHVMIWDGRNESGEQVASGVYFCRLEAGAMVRIRKLALIK